MNDYKACLDTTALGATEDISISADSCRSLEMQYCSDLLSFYWCRDQSGRTVVEGSKKASNTSLWHLELRSITAETAVSLSPQLAVILNVIHQLSEPGL